MMNHTTLYFPNLSVATSDADDGSIRGSSSRNENGDAAVVPTAQSSLPSTTTTRVETTPPPPPLNPREYVDQHIIPHRLQIGLGIHHGAHGSLYKCHTLYLEYKSLRQQLQQGTQPKTNHQDNENDTGANELVQLRQKLQQTQRQLITELQLQQLEFQKLIYLQQHQRCGRDVRLHHNNDSVDLHPPTTSTVSSSSSLPVLRQRFHQVQQLHSYYQEYNAIIQVLHSSSNNNPTSITTTTETINHKKNSNNEALQTTYQALLHDKQILQDQISNKQQKEIQLRKQQLHLLQQTIQDMKTSVSSK